MSAPSTNVEKQERRHKPVLMVLRGLIILAAVILVGFIALQVIGSGTTPEAGLVVPTVAD
ncbi:hypothetical protein [Roseicyclus mahoneyensis]|jgi:hypothetical protein|uniref:Uncharacterized protein n=1 Tax=Roseicyclus mahoneyensis TaxID=164332 RepID=A0A316GLN8_9RHOB|nr:hypothetical protein [Roseicyclus mahoneyensis]PWK62097.1 hypothetical protein C7455_101123 [Roseicyclus mahoneyensis]